VRPIFGWALILLTACALGGAFFVAAGEMRAYPPAEPANPLKFLMQGEDFLIPTLRAQQADDFDNPAFPLVEAGEAAWTRPETGAAKACQDCHGAGGRNAVKQAVASYPKYAPDVRGVISLETRINLCRKNHLGLDPLPGDDPRIIAMTAYLRWLARGSPSTVSVTGPNAEVFERGSRLFQTKLGRFQISCAQCHNEKFGQKYGADTISQGHPLAYPAFKSSEGRVITLHERFRMCNRLARAEGLPDDAPDYVALELYLGWRSKNLPITAPGVRP